MGNLILRTWNSKPSTSRDFEIITKFTTLGNPLGLKSILGFFYNLRQNTAYTIDTNNNYCFTLYYRLELNEPWIMLDIISNSATFDDEGPTTIIKKKMLDIPIKNVSEIQLRIHSPLVKGDFNINDFGLIYRDVRSTSVSDHDDN